MTHYDSEDCLSSGSIHPVSHNNNDRSTPTLTIHAQVGLLRLLYLGLRELSPYTFRGLKDVRVLSIENSDLATIKERAFQGERQHLE